MSVGQKVSAVKAVRAALLASLAASSVAACGGGGGGGGGTGSTAPSPMLPPDASPAAAPPVTPPPPVSPPALPTSTFETKEYFGSTFTSGNRSGLGQIHASSAYARGATGKGITVAVIDSNVDSTISELQGQISASYDVNSVSRETTDVDSGGHGTTVASVIVARKDDKGVHGVAYDAKVLAIRADTQKSCNGSGGDSGGCQFSDTSLISAINYAVSNGAKVINMSLGGEGTISARLKTAIVNATNAGVVFAISAGNDGAAATDTAGAKGQNPHEPAIVATDAAVRGRVIAVGAVGPDGTMPTYSNRAGSAAKYYLLAPGGAAKAGQNLVVAGLGGNYYGVAGTSFAAPHVAGALALMLQLFPNITPENAVLALLETADDYVTSSPDAVVGLEASRGTDIVGGRGIMNLERAFAPIGTTSFTFDGQQVEIATTMSPARGAMGDWVQNSAAFEGLIFQDKYQRAFRIENANMVAPRSTFNNFQLHADYARGHARRVAMGGMEMSWFNAPPPVYDPRVPWAEAPEPTFELSYSFANTDVSVGRGGGPQRLTPAMTLIDDPSGPASLGAGDSWTSYAQSFGPMTLDVRTSSGLSRHASSMGIGAGDDDWAMRLGYASLADNESTLGGAFQSRFGGEDETRLSAVSLEGRRYLGSWAFSGALEAASARVNAMDVAGLWTSSWSLSAEHPLVGGWLRFTAGQPRRAEGGDLTFNAPVQITDQGYIIYERRVASLTPSGRELDFEAAWSANLNDFTTFQAAAALSNQPNHIANAETEAALWLSLRHAW